MLYILRIKFTAERPSVNGCNRQKMGVEPQSIEQPLDFEIPESKIMLAIYLAAPEVDNDRRALNIFHGMRRGKKEGRWLGSCLRGYINTRDENNRPIIAPEGGKKEELVNVCLANLLQECITLRN